MHDDLDGGRMHWFGQDWGSWLCRECRHVATPAGEPCLWCDEPIVAGGPCLWCDEPIVAGEQGVTQWVLRHDEPPARRPMHLECHLRSVVGGLNHLLGRCTCCGGQEPPDPPELSRREAARAAVRIWEQGHGR